MTRARDAGLLDHRAVEEVALQWDALCHGLATREICGYVDPAQAERLWSDALNALLTGMAGEVAPA